MRAAFLQKTTRVYERRLPGLGVAAIDVTVVRGNWRIRKYWGELVIEREAESWRRDGHKPLVVARAMGPSAAAVLERLVPIAERSAWPESTRSSNHASGASTSWKCSPPRFRL